MMKSDDRLDLLFVIECAVAALHRHQDTVRARLHRQVQMADQFRHLGIGLDQRIGKLDRV